MTEFAFWGELYPFNVETLEYSRSKQQSHNTVLSHWLE